MTRQGLSRETLAAQASGESANPDGTGRAGIAYTRADNPTYDLNGHSDVLAGAVVTARRDPFSERIRSWRRNAGCVPGPFEAWLLQRGMRTLFIRVRHASDTAMRVARHFEGHPALAAILYPGLLAHPGHEIAARQHRRSTEGASSPVPADLLRLSVGLESAEDLSADLAAALDAAPAIRKTVTAPPSSGKTPPPEASDITARITAVVEATVAPAIIARGGSIHVVSVDRGVVTLEAAGSPGAIVPMAARIEALLRTAAPEITEVKVRWPGETPPRDDDMVAA